VVENTELIHDWNKVNCTTRDSQNSVQLNDETLRDGLQSPTVQDPPIQEKIQLLHLMEALGIDMVDIGLPGAGDRTYTDALELAREISKSKLKIAPNCAARTMIRDIQPISSIAQKSGTRIVAALFLGSSMIRQYVENWEIDTLLRRTEEAVSFAVKEDLQVMYVTEDTSRAHPETIRKLYAVAIQCGARQLVVTDTVGHSTPDGVRALMRFMVRELIEPSDEEITLAWHGHNDRGLAVTNALKALEEGADVVHGCALGVGERVGNASMDQILVNLKLLGWIDRDLSALKEYCDVASRACGVPIPPGYPVVGSDAFRTAAGIHAAAVIKAIKKDEPELADSVYSGVPANLFGLEQTIGIGHMSGKSNVIYWLEKRGIEATEERVQAIYDYAKKSDRLLTNEEILQIARPSK